MTQLNTQGSAHHNDSPTRSPMSEEEYACLRRTVYFTHDDREYLEEVAEVLDDRLDEVVDVWLTFLADNEFLHERLGLADGTPVDQALEQARPMLARWIEDTCHRKYDQKWLDHQHEMASRFAGDGGRNLPLRYMVGFVYPMTATVQEFLKESDHDAHHIDRMCEAWFKAVVMQVALWTAPYAKDGEF